MSTPPAGGSAPVPGSHAAVTVLASPLDGRALPLTRVPDPVFSRGNLGTGAAVEPSGDTVHAPAAGRVVVVHATGHAVGLALDSGIDVLIHVGTDTADLDGRGFDVHVHAGQVVAAGDRLVTFDRGIIEAAGHSPVTAVVVTNHERFSEVERVGDGTVATGDPLLRVTAVDREDRGGPPQG